MGSGASRLAQQDLQQPRFPGSLASDRAQLLRLFLIILLLGEEGFWAAAPCGGNRCGFHFRVWRGKLRLWGFGTRPAPNVTAEVLGSGPAKFLPAFFLP